MNIELDRREAEILIAALTAQEYKKDFPEAAIEKLRPFRSRLLQSWLSERIAKPGRALEAREG